MGHVIPFRRPALIAKPRARFGGALFFGAWLMSVAWCMALADAGRR